MSAVAPLPLPEPDVSVVIPSYEAGDHLRATLNALLAQTVVDRMEIMVVDCSTTDTVEEICVDLDVVCLRRTERFNPGIGRNIGVANTTAPIVVFVDADVILESSAIERAIGHHRRGRRVFGGSLELNTDHVVGRSSWLEHWFFNHESQRLRQATDRRNLSSAFMVVDREVFESSGGFRDIPRMQDTELTERLADRGIALTFQPDVAGLQIQDSSMESVMRKIEINGRNLYVIRYKERGERTRKLLFAALPAMTAAKFVRIVGRHLRYQDRAGRIRTLQLIPDLARAHGKWMSGFYESLRAGDATLDDRR